MANEAIQYGATGDNVKELQTTLNSAGNYGLDVDGSFGPATLAAVKDYQSKNGLAVDGSVGPQTSASLAAYTAGQTPTAAAPATNTPAEQTPATVQPIVTATMPNIDANAMVEQQKQSIPDVNQAKTDQRATLEQWKTTLLQQSNNQIDYNVAKAITELERALEDAQPQYKEQQESITRDEMQSLDNSALYAEARGDKGGIGQEQYNSIQNTAAQNRLSVQQAQTKLATDTQRQIADLRAQGEFDKADAMLEVSQQYLSQLMSLEQWAFDAGMTTAQFQASLDEWLADYQMTMTQYQTEVDMWNADYNFNQTKFDYEKTQNANSQLISTGEAMLSAGVMPSASQLAAMKMSTEQAKAYIEAAKLAASTGGTTGGETEDPAYVSGYQQAYNAGCRTYADAFEFFTSKQGGDHPTEEAAELADYFVEKWIGDKTGFLNLPNYEDILKKSEAGLLGPQFGKVLTMVQSKWIANETNEEIAVYLEEELEAGNINDFGLAEIMLVLGIA